ncbi:hypothetical protein HPB50_019529 [Hyalomma asiaticum]|uniref:Uncharacterized protein n=1 Tax=Hyalomma asiaticum TaxID=266040 RepID=A0ACB7S3X7_HYAAI|nr:hypothetical protein HPB50_019529 [Hyalomma asiaticum]
MIGTCPQLNKPNVEAQSFLYRIASETTRYYHAASVVPPDVASELSDVLSNLSDSTPYQHLKTKALERFMPLERVRLRQLLAEGALATDAPPNYCAKCDRHGEHKVSNHSPFLRELFLQSLRQPIRLVLAAAGDVSLDRLAELADKVHEATAHPSTLSQHQQT